MFEHGCRVLVREEAKSREEGGPAPGGRAHGDNVDTEDGAGGCTADVDWPIHLVKLCQVERGERGGGGGGRDEPVGGVEAGESDSVTGVESQDAGVRRERGHERDRGRVEVHLLSQERWHWERFTA